MGNTYRSKLEAQLCDIACSMDGKSIPQHCILMGEEGTGKTFFLNNLALKLKYSGKNPAILHSPYPLISCANDVISALPDALDVLLVDDFDKLLSTLTVQEQYKLRSFLFREKAPMLIGVTTGSYMPFSNYQAPFYDAFKNYSLRVAEPEDLSPVISVEQYNSICADPQVSTLIEDIGGKLFYIIELITLISNGSSSDDAIEKIVSDNDRYFNLLFESLPKNEQKALLLLTQAGGISTTKELKESSYSSIISSSFNRLETRGIISRTKNINRNAEYRIKDTFFYYWLKERLGNVVQVFF